MITDDMRTRTFSLCHQGTQSRDQSAAPAAAAADPGQAARAAAAVAAAKAQLQDRPRDFFKSDFFEMEAEMSDDEGHSTDGDDDDANADGMLVSGLGAPRHSVLELLAEMPGSPT